MTTRSVAFSVVLFMTLVFGATPSSVSAQEQEGSGATSEGAASEQSEKAEPKEIVTAIVGADIHTAVGEIIRRGTILVRGGKIVAVGQDVTVPQGAEVIDATGKVVTPGFVSISMTGVGLRGGAGGGRGGAGPDGGESNNAEESQLIDTLDPFDRNIKYVLSSGITTGCVQLSSGGGRGRRGRDGAPDEFFLGLEVDPREELVDLDSDLTEEEAEHLAEEDAICGCCGLDIAPTEPLTPAPPTEATPRRHAVLKMSFGHLDTMLVKEQIFHDLPAGALSSAESRHKWRADIKRVRAALIAQESDAAARQQEAEATPDANQGQGRRGGRGGRGAGRGGRGGARDGEANDAALQKLVKKEVPLRTEANTVDEIRDMIALSKELDYNLVLEGVVEGWVVASELGEAKVPVIYTPRQKRQARKGFEDSSGSSIESTGLFEKTGVPFAIAALESGVSMGGIAGRDLMSLPLEAAFAVRGGASQEEALEAITIVPARMLGLEGRIGSIEVGKDADILILDGPPLDYRTYVQTAIVAGKVSYEREKDGIYPPRDIAGS